MTPILTVLEVIISLLYGPFFLQISSVASTYIVTVVFFPLLSSRSNDFTILNVKTDFCLIRNNERTTIGLISQFY